MRTAWIGILASVLGCATGVTLEEGDADAVGATSAAGTGGSASSASSVGAGGADGGASAASASSSSASASSSSASSSSASTSSASSSSSGTSGGGGGVVVVDCGGCTPSPVGSCASDVVVVGHYEGGTRTVCVEAGDGTPFELALMSYETTEWQLGGEIGRISQIQIYSVDPFGSIAGNGAIPTSIQVGGSVPADPYAYAPSMGDCPAHTGYTGAVYGVPQPEVCHMETGLPGACGYPAYACLAVDP